MRKNIYNYFTCHDEILREIALRKIETEAFSIEVQKLGWWVLSHSIGN